MSTTKTNAERETVILRSADESDWTVYSEDPRVIRRLSALHGPGKPKGSGFDWRLPEGALSFRRPVVLDAAERERRKAVFAATLAKRKAASG